MLLCVWRKGSRRRTRAFRLRIFPTTHATQLTPPHGATSPTTPSTPRRSAASRSQPAPRRCTRTSCSAGSPRTRLHRPAARARRAAALRRDAVRAVRRSGGAGARDLPRLHDGAVAAVLRRARDLTVFVRRKKCTPYNTTRTQPTPPPGRQQSIHPMDDLSPAAAPPVAPPAWKAAVPCRPPRPRRRPDPDPSPRGAGRGRGADEGRRRCRRSPPCAAAMGVMVLVAIILVVSARPWPRGARRTVRDAALRAARARLVGARRARRRRRDLSTAAKAA